MRRSLLALVLFPLTLLACSDHDRDDDRDHDSYENRACQVGVSFRLDALQSELDEHDEVDILACFDRSCDQLTLKVTPSGHQCEGAPGGPPDQLTGCSFRQKGLVSVNILRTDGLDYSDGEPHTAAISILDEKGERLFAHAESVRFSDRTCGLTPINLSWR